MSDTSSDMPKFTGKRGGISTARYVRSAVDQMRAMHESTHQMVGKVAKDQQESSLKMSKLVAAITGDDVFGHKGLIKEVQELKAETATVAAEVRVLVPRVETTELEHKRLRSDVAAMKIDKRVVLKVIAILVGIISATAAAVEVAAWGFEHLKQLFGHIK